MKFLLNIFVVVLAAAFVAAESELAHAMEMVYMYSKYQTERVVYNEGFWLAPGCKGSGAKGGCSFNQFVSYVKRGTITGAPEIIELDGKFDWTNTAEVQKTVTKMSAMKDPARPSQLYMAGDLSAGRVNPNVNGFTGLYTSFENFDKQVAADIDKMSAGADKTTAKTMLDVSNNNILKAAFDLRSATRFEKLHDELTKKFSPSGKNDKVYEYTDQDGNTKRFDPVQWVVEKKTLWGRSFNSINLQKSAEKNPQMNDPILKQRIQDHIKLFNSDGEDGKGKGLMVYDPRYAGTNGRHQNVIDKQNKVGSAYQKNCK